MVHRVMARLIEGGHLGTGAAEGKPVGWEINVINDDCEFWWECKFVSGKLTYWNLVATLNAFVLPGGKVFVFTGILPVCRNDSGLAAVLGE